MLSDFTEAANSLSGFTGQDISTNAQLGINQKLLGSTDYANAFNLANYYNFKNGSGSSGTENANLITGLAVESTSLDSPFSSGWYTVGDAGKVSFDYLFDGGAYKGELAIFSLKGLGQYELSSNAFVQEVAKRALSNSTLGYVVISDSSEGARFSGKFPKDGNFQEGDYFGVKTFTMNPGDQFGIMLVPNGTVQEIFNNPNLNRDKSPLLSLTFANPNSGFLVGQIADVTGKGSTFVFEDLRVDGSSDRDYNDIIFQVQGALGKAVSLDEVINSALEWRDSQMGKALLAYVAPYDNPQTFQTVNFDFPATDQPLIGIIDTGFSANNPDIDYSRIIKGRDRVDGDDNPLLDFGTGNEHGTHILGIIAATRNNGIGIDGINDKAPIWLGRAVGSGQWANSLVEFVDYARQSRHPNALVNLSFDLTQVNADGSVTTRYELTPEERSAIEYARQHNVFLVTSAGNDGGVMSVLGQASQEFDNIMTVGAADGLNRANYSSYGYGLDIVAEGGTSENPILSTVGDGVGTMAGTSAAVAFVTGAISQVWAARPKLSYRQVINAVKLTATDIDKPNWDEETGAGLLNTEAAVSLADTIEPQTYYAPATLIPESWSGAGKVTSAERAASVQFSGKNYNWEWYTVKSGDTLSEIALRTMGNGTESYYNFIAQYNGIKNPSLIYPGQRIEIPKAASINEFEGKRYEWVSYTVRPGDTLSEIALRTIGNGTEPYYNFIAQHNRINNPSQINAGQQIEIPREVKNQEPTPNPKPIPTPNPTPTPNPIDPIDSRSDNYRNGQVNPFAYRWQGQCTWYAYGRMLDTGLLPAAAKANGSFLGNAESWTRDAKNAGLDVTSKPTPGMRGLTVWSPNAKGASRWGHVAFLEEVYTDGRIRISEANWTNQGISERILTPAEYDGLSFVRLENAATKPILSSPPAQLGKQRQHIVQSGESVWGIAQTYLGDGKRWREIRKADGSQFTDVEAGKLQMGASVYLPVSYQSEPGKSVTIQPVNTPILIEYSNITDDEYYANVFESAPEDFQEYSEKDISPSIKDLPLQEKLNKFINSVKDYTGEYIKEIGEAAINDVVSSFNSIIEDINKLPNIDYLKFGQKIFDFAVEKVLGKTLIGRGILIASGDKKPTEVLASIFEFIKTSVTDPRKAWEEANKLFEDTNKAIGDIKYAINQLIEESKNLQSKIEAAQTKANLNKVAEVFVEFSVSQILNVSANLLTGQVKIVNPQWKQNIQKTKILPKFRINNSGLNHIFNGGVDKFNESPKAIGYHSIYSFEQGRYKGKITKKLEKPGDFEGVYQANVVVIDTQDNNKEYKKLNTYNKESPSTFFPDFWDRDKILTEVRYAYDNRTKIPDQNSNPRGHEKWVGVSSDGYQIEMWIDNKGHVVSAYPRFKKK